MLPLSLHSLLHEPRHRAAWSWMCAVLATAVAVAALTPGALATTMTSSDKIDHLLAFCALSATGLLATAPGHRNSLLVGGVMLAYGALIEVLQAQVPGRFGDPLDAAADGIGIVIGLALAAGLRGLYPKDAAGTTQKKDRP